MTTKVIKTRAAEAKNTASNIFRNLVEFAQAASLVTVAVVAGIAAKTGSIEITGVYAYITAAAVAVIALMAAVILVRHFNK